MKAVLKIDEKLAAVEARRKEIERLGAKYAELMRENPGYSQSDCLTLLAAQRIREGKRPSTPVSVRNFLAEGGYL